MSEELIQRKLIDAPERIGEWNFYNIGSTTLSSLKKARIIPDRDYAGCERKKPDAIIAFKQNVIAAIEYKTPKELTGKKKIDAAIKQEICTARALGANVYVVTDGSKSYWINPVTGNRILDENGREVSLLFDYKSEQCVTLLRKIIASITPKCDRILLPKIVDPLPLATKVWQDLWSVSGATPENCLYTFVEIFIFKYLSDLGVLSGIYSFDNLLDAYSKNSESDVLDSYAKTIRPKIKTLFPKGELDHTTIINGTILVSKDENAVDGYSAVFKKILQRFADFGPLSNIDRDFKSRLFETFLKESISKKNWGQYFTPLKVVRAIVNMVDVHPGMSLCDPACGVGKFLLEPIVKNIDRYFEIKNGRLVSHIQLAGFDKGFDREEQKTIILAKANMLIYMAELLRDNPSATESFAEEFNRTFTLQTNSILGTLAHPFVDQYDLILTNPPYVMSGSSNLKEEISKSARLKSHYAINAMGIEGLFMEWIVRALKPGGKAFVVVPDGIFNRANDQKLRDFILKECCIDAIISLPINTFFTTNKKTYILAITKKEQRTVMGVSSLTRQDTPVFTYLCSEIGESRDAYRFDIEQNDLQSATVAFNMFKGAKGTFKTADGRCKIVPIARFENSDNWCVDRWWSQKEKIALGINNEERDVDVGEFRVMLSDVISSFSELNDMLQEGEPGQKYSMSKMPLSTLFDTVKGVSKYTKKFGNEHKGPYPVYSASSQSPLTWIDTYDYDGKYMTWSTNGFAGTILVLDGKFSLNGDRGILLPKNGRTDLDLDYMKYTLEPIFRNMAKGRKGDNGEDEFTKLYPSMIGNVEVPVPVTKKGVVDFEAQVEIARKYKMIEQCKAEILSRCNSLVAQRIEL